MEIMLDLPVRVTTSPNILYQPLNEGAVILNLENEQYYTLDEVGVRLWQLIDEHHELAMVIECILEEYDVDEDSLRQDLRKFLYELLEDGLIRVVL